MYCKVGEREGMSNVGRAHLERPHHAVPERCLCISLSPNPSDAVPVSSTTPHPCPATAALFTHSSFSPRKMFVWFRWGL